MRIFGDKLYKSSQRQGIHPRTPVHLRRLGDLPPDPSIVTLACYYNFVQFISDA